MKHKQEEKTNKRKNKHINRIKRGEIKKIPIHLVGDELSFGVLLELSGVCVRLNRILANVSNFVLTNGDFSVCSLSELSCSELAERTLK